MRRQDITPHYSTPRIASPDSICAHRPRRERTAVHKCMHRPASCWQHTQGPGPAEHTCGTGRSRCPRRRASRRPRPPTRAAAGPAQPPPAYASAACPSPGAAGRRKLSRESIEVLGLQREAGMRCGTGLEAEALCGSGPGGLCSASITRLRATMPGANGHGGLTCAMRLARTQVRMARRESRPTSARTCGMGMGRRDARRGLGEGARAGPGAGTLRVLARAITSRSLVSMTLEPPTPSVTHGLACNSHVGTSRHTTSHLPLAGRQRDGGREDARELCGRQQAQRLARPEAEVRLAGDVVGEGLAALTLVQGCGVRAGRMAGWVTARRGGHLQLHAAHASCGWALSTQHGQSTALTGVVDD
jgi:hypothetical protein